MMPAAKRPRQEPCASSAEANPVVSSVPPAAAAIRTRSFEQTRGVTILFCAAAAAALGWALQFSNGNLHPDAFLLLCVTLCLTACALVLPRWGFLERNLERLVMVVLAGALFWQTALILRSPPAMYLRPGLDGYGPFLTGVAAVAMLAAAGLSPKGWLGRLRIPLLVGAWLFIAGWILERSPRPRVDVFVWHVEAIRAFLDGHNPYAMTMPDIYGHDRFYGPGLLVNGRVDVGFPYPPLSLYVSTLGHVLGGDYRWANAVAIGGAGLLMAFAAPSRWSPVVASIFLLTPRTFFVLEHGWTDAYAVFFLALVVFCAVRFPRALPVALGSFFAIKHYLVLAAPLVVLLMPRPLSWRDLLRTLGIAVAVAALVTLPLAVLDPRAFFRDLVWFQSNQPFRTDALSFLAWHASRTGERLSTIWGFAAWALALVIGLWRAPRNPSGFAAAVAFAFLLFFAFSKQAFSNYYFFIIGALCTAVAVARPGTAR